ncbi:MAG: CotS family spore coat protein [Lachnospiraceae bacterium]|nr:CotS family spore coat protein [Lachnospiraceae bacterium]
MNDRAVSLLDQYEIEVRRTWKGRGAILCDSDRGLLIMKEYGGPVEKIAFQQYLLAHIRERGTVRAETLLRTKEDELIVRDQDRTAYIVKTYCEGKECDHKNAKECALAVETLAKLHDASDLSGSAQLEEQSIFNMESEYEKHNRELKKVRKFLREKSQKTEFEIYLMKHYDYFLDIALQITGDLRYYAYGENSYAFPIVCHGDYQYHNIIQTDEGSVLVNFEKCVRDYPVRDLYLFMRKLLEKNNWSQALGDLLLTGYNGVRPLNEGDYRQLYLRFAYPEKFWKIVNFYYNSGKAWIPGRNMEKLEKLFAQEREKKLFLKSLFPSCAP